MGVIYTSSELKSGLIPREGDHERAAIAVLERVSKLDTSVLTVVHGSVPEGRSNVRSDLDVLVTYTFDDKLCEPEIVDGIKTELDEIGVETHVKIEANLWPADEPTLARIERMYDLLFSRHLATSMVHPRWSIGKPDEGVQTIASTFLDVESVRKVALNYTTYKHSGFTKAPRAFNESDKSTITSLQRALEFPKSAGRKLGQLMGVVQEVPVDDYRGSLASSGVHDELLIVIEELRDIDKGYSTILEELLERREELEPCEVEEYLQWVSDRYPKALNLGMMAATGFIDFVCQI